MINRLGFSLHKISKYPPTNQKKSHYYSSATISQIVDTQTVTMVEDFKNLPSL